MAIWKDQNGVFHDDDNGRALSLPGWPKNLILSSAAERDAANAPTAAQIWATYQAQAQIALDKSDMVALRCLKAGVAFPAAWQTYTLALRAIMGQTTGTPGTLPTAPAYPAGT